MKLKLIFWLSLVLALAACTPATPATPDAGMVETAIAQTQAAQPTVTPSPADTPEPTAIPLSDIDLTGMVIVDGDFPPAIEKSVIVNSPPIQKPYDVFPQADQFFLQEVENTESHETGEIAIVLYADRNQAGQAYSALAGHEYFIFQDGQVEPMALDGTGEQGVARFEANLFGDWFRVAFVRCSAVVYIAMPMANITDNRYVSNYASRLDGRLTELLCP